jgi:hypothetical protein
MLVIVTRHGPRHQLRRLALDLDSLDNAASRLQIGHGVADGRLKAVADWAHERRPHRTPIATTLRAASGERTETRLRPGYRSILRKMKQLGDLSPNYLSHRGLSVIRDARRGCVAVCCDLFRDVQFDALRSAYFGQLRQPVANVPNPVRTHLGSELGHVAVESLDPI